MRARQAIPSSVRERVLFNGRCVYCGATKDLVVDHVMPHSRGGSDAEHNLAPACEPCNQEKGDLTPTEWRMWRDRAGLGWPVERESVPAPDPYFAWLWPVMDDVSCEVINAPNNTRTLHTIIRHLRSDHQLDAIRMAVQRLVSEGYLDCRGLYYHHVNRFMMPEGWLER